MYMTRKKYDKLELTRDYISFFGFALIMLNLILGLALTVGSILKGESLIACPISLIAVMIIAVLIGILAILNFFISKKLKSIRIKY